MGKDIFNFEKTLLDLEIRGEIFQPNLTTKLSIETAIEKIKNNITILDLGCGSGIIGIALMKTFQN